MTAPNAGGTTTGPQPSIPPPPAPIQVSGPLWRLEADPALIDDAAQAWRYIGTRVREISEDVKNPADRLLGGGWTGTTADTFDEHRRTFLRDLYAEGDLADFAAGRLEHTAGTVRSAQNQLDGSWSHLVARVRASAESSGNVMLHPSDEAQVALVYGSIREAEAIRAELDDILLDDVVGLERIRREWQVIADALQATATGAAEAFILPPEATGTLVIRDGDNVVINTGPGDDRVEVLVDPATGQQTVVVNGVASTYPPGANITIRAGEGNDDVVVPSGTQVRVTLLGGGGDDELRGGGGADTILGGSGRDKVFAGGGDDRVSGGTDGDYLDGSGGNDILDGGLDDDTVYGLSGHDQISGGEGRDYLEGGTGNDTLDGGAGNDMISGGRGDDRMRGGTGDDAMYAGFGRDALDGGAGQDVSYSQSDDVAAGAERVVTVELTDAGSTIKIEGSPEFVERVQADIDMLRSSPRGQEMLAALDARQETGADGNPVTHAVTIREGNSTFEFSNPQPGMRGTSSEVNYDPSLDHARDGTPPVVGLYHELAHSYDALHGTTDGGVHIDPATGRPVSFNYERVATGLPVDHDGNPATPPQLHPDHPHDLTENALREELGYDRREDY